jgi:hypothetical protein
VETAGKLPENLWKKIRNCCGGTEKNKIGKAGEKNLGADGKEPGIYRIGDVCEICVKSSGICTITENRGRRTMFDQANTVGRIMAFNHHL